MSKQFTDKLNAGECTFQLTGSNDIMLRMLAKYMMMLEYVASSTGDEESKLNIDGLINYLLDEALDRTIRDIVKRHGFGGKDDFFQCISECEDGEEVRAYCEQRQNNQLLKMHNDILAQIPMDAPQQKLPI